jgi:hypothetical protein
MMVNRDVSTYQALSLLGVDSDCLLSSGLASLSLLFGRHGYSPGLSNHTLFHANHAVSTRNGALLIESALQIEPFFVLADSSTFPRTPYPGHLPEQVNFLESSPNACI